MRWPAALLLLLCCCSGPQPMNADNVLEQGEAFEKSGRDDDAGRLYLDCLNGCDDGTVRLLVGPRLRRLAPPGSKLEEAVRKREKEIEQRILDRPNDSKSFDEDLIAIISVASAWEDPSAVRRILNGLRQQAGTPYEHALTVFASNVPEFVELDDRDAAFLRRAPIVAYESDRKYLLQHPESPKRMEQEFSQIRATHALAFAAALVINDRLTVARSLLVDLVALDQPGACESLLEGVAGFPARDVRVLTCEACSRPPSCAD